MWFEEFISNRNLLNQSRGRIDKTNVRMLKKIEGKEIPDIAQNEAENVHWIKPEQLQAILRSFSETCFSQ